MSFQLPETFVPGFHNEEAVRKMKYNKLGNTGMSVSQLSLGTAGFCLLFGNYSPEECKAALLLALKNGVNYIDTAPWYGQGVSEEVLGKCLEGIPRKAYYIATKVSRYEKDPKLMFDFTAEKTRNSINISLKKLKLDYVDVIQIHDVDFAPNKKIVLEETLPVLQEAVNDGKAKFIGITGYTISYLQDIIQQSNIKIDTVLSYARMSMIDQSLKDFIPYFQSKQLGIINGAPHCMGLLSSAGPQDWHPAAPEIKDICTEARQYCKDNGVELGKLALYYTLQQPGPHLNLVGMNTRQLVNFNLEVVQKGLNAKELQVYEHVKNKIFSKLTITNWENVELEAYKKQIM